MLRPLTARRAAAVVATCAALTLAAGGVTASAAPGGTPGAPDAGTGDSSAVGGVDQTSALVQLSLDPVSTSNGVARGRNGRVDLNDTKTKNVRAQLNQQRNDLKAWLRTNAPAVKVTGEFDISLNAVSVQLNGTSLDLLRSAPNVVSASYENTYVPLDVNDPDLSLIDAQAGWKTAGVGGGANAGAGVKVAVIDTGIDAGHPCFDGRGDNTPDPLTNGRVTWAAVYNNKAAQRGLDARAVQEHGTHVAGTIGCDLDTSATLSGVDVPYDVSGVAPAVELGNFNIFPGDVENARSEDILNALDAAYTWGAQVANMSLGGGAHGVQDLLTRAVDDLDKAGMVVAVAAGNSGPGHYTVESPGSAERALTAGASTVGHYVGAPISAGTVSTAGAVGDFPVVPAGGLTAPLAVVTGTGNALGLACSALPAGSLTGKVALVSRGTCTFGTKIYNADQAGAVAVLVVNNVAGDPTAMAGDATVPTVDAPAYMVSLTDGTALKALNGTLVTIGSQLTYLRSGNDDIMAGFSSQGPTDVDYRVKPDVVAPGVNVISSFPDGPGLDGEPYCADPAAGCFGQISGTSMATPHLAGIAAVVRQVHPTWTAEMVRAAIVGTAQSGRLTTYQTGTALVDDVNIVGTGIAQLDAALGATVGVLPVSTSFGAVPSGSGQALTRQITLASLDGKAHTVTLSLERQGKEGFALGTTTVTVPAGGTATATVTFTAAKRTAAGDRDDYLVVSERGATLARSALYAFVK